MRDYIMSEIERRRAELAGLETRRLILTSQLDVLDDMLAHLPTEHGHELKATEHSLRLARGTGKSVKGHLTERWMPVLIEAVRRYPFTVRTDEAPTIQNEAGQEPAEASNV